MGPLAATGTFSKIQKLIEVEDKAILPRPNGVLNRWRRGGRWESVMFYKWLLVPDSRLSGGPLRIWEDNDLWWQGLRTHAQAI